MLPRPRLGPGTTENIAASTSLHLWLATMRLPPRPCDDHGVRTTVLIVDDHDDFRESARKLLDAEGFAVLGGAADGRTAVIEATRLHPDVVLLDVQLPDVDGFAVAEELAALRDPPRVVLISSRAARTYGSRVVAARVVGFLAKHELSGASLAALLG